MLIIGVYLLFSYIPTSHTAIRVYPPLTSLYVQFCIQRPPPLKDNVAMVPLAFDCM
ncbi:hypothetical protein EVA_18041 [gut metagenome]|uniref:Uncharacterized protein n=1 Tax=gut metagenome TaxID=749906 RepID=J9FWA5_9ZZZZ